MTSAPETRITVTTAPGRWPGFGLAELWQYRDLLGFLVWREIKVRYAQTVLGVTWVVLQPLVMVGIFAVIFGHFMRVPADGMPYALFSLAGLVPWLYVSSVISGASESLVMERNLITKVYFPRVLIPLATVLAGLLDLGIGLVLVMLFAAVFGWVPSMAGLLALPALVPAAVLTATGAGLLLATLNLQFRDVRYVVPFLLQVWMFASPIVYPASLVPEPLRPLYGLNPMVGVIEGFRGALTGGTAAGAATIAVSLGAGVALFAGAFLYFRLHERTFADRV
jgi:lipopolysaccharide transport system permease protein